MMTSFELSNSLSRYLDFVLGAKREDEEGHEGAEHAETGHPPDVPDQRKASDNVKKCVDEADRAVPRHLDRLVFTRFRRLIWVRLLAPFGGPIGVGADNLRQESKIPSGGRRGHGPFQGAAIPRVAGEVAMLRTIA